MDILSWTKRQMRRCCAAIETGTKADVKQYYFDKAKKELDEKLDEKAYPEAYDKAWDKIVEEIDDKYADAEEKYELNDPDFTEVPVKVYENFFRNEEEDYNKRRRGRRKHPCLCKK